MLNILNTIVEYAVYLAGVCAVYLWFENYLIPKVREWAEK